MKRAVAASKIKRAGSLEPLVTKMKEIERPAARIRNFTRKKTAAFAPCFLICFMKMKIKKAAIRKVTVKE